MYRCEHCGSLCHVAPVCGRCGKEHGPEFFKDVSAGSKGSAIFWSLFILDFIVLGIIGEFFEIEFLVMTGIQFSLIPIIFILAAFWAKNHPPKQITLKNGKTITL